MTEISHPHGHQFSRVLLGIGQVSLSAQMSYRGMWSQGAGRRFWFPLNSPQVLEGTGLPLKTQQVLEGNSQRMPGSPPTGPRGFVGPVRDVRQDWGADWPWHSAPWWSPAPAICISTVGGKICFFSAGGERKRLSC